MNTTTYEDLIANDNGGDLPVCFDKGVCHECDTPISKGNPIEVTVHDETGYHLATCKVCDECFAVITLPVDAKVR